VLLSPFIVSTEKDSGYKATNSTSGTRLSTAIRDVPMDLEVLTSQFITDTGSSNLREALRFSAGVVQNSQVDGLVNPGTYDNAGNSGSNDPAGITRDANQTTFKIRGLIIDQVLRDGFSRQAPTDSINVERIEVLRGPSALLYGVGNFGGVINYIPKRPEAKASAAAEVTFGSEGFLRETLDLTGPVLANGLVTYRLTAADQQNGNFTDLYNSHSQFISPVLAFRPWKNTLITIDNEWGHVHTSGDGFQSIRAVDSSNGSEANSRRADFIGRGKVNLRTFRWSGPDTYHDISVRNHLLSINQKIFEGLDLQAGLQRTATNRKSQQIPYAHVDGSGVFQPTDIYQGHFLGDILYRHFEYTQIGVDPTDYTAQYAHYPTDTAVIKYQWSQVFDDETRDQARVELNYHFNGFGKHNILLGVQYQKASDESLTRSNPRSSNTRQNLKQSDIYNFHAVDDFGYFFFDRQGYGGASLPVVPLDGTRAINWDAGAYAIYQGQFFKDHLTLIGGVRHDRTDAYNATIAYDDIAPKWTEAAKAVTKAPTKNSPQIGVNVKIINGLSIYAVHSTGIVPNYYLTDGAGVPLQPTQSKSNEVGLKFDLLNGKISGTISAYRIKRSGTPRYIWWAPNLVKMQRNYDPNKPLGYYFAGITQPFLDYIKTKPYYNQLDPNHTVTPGGNLVFSVPGPDSAGAKVLDDAVQFQSQSYLNWPGWMFESGYSMPLSDGSGNVFLNSPGSNANDGAYVPIDDQNQGFDAQFVISPTSDWQIVATYAHNENKMTSAYKYVKVPYVFGSQWAIWNFPTYGWGTFQGIPKEQAYTDYTDSSTYKGIGVGTGESLDGSPSHVVTLWSRYDFRHVDMLKGFVGAFGGTWQSPEKWTNGYATDGTWIAVPGADGKLHSLIQETKSRLTLSLMGEYTYLLPKNRAVSVRLNVDNLLDDQSRYGLVYAPGVSYRLSAKLSF